MDETEIPQHHDSPPRQTQDFVTLAIPTTQEDIVLVCKILAEAQIKTLTTNEAAHGLIGGPDGVRITVPRAQFAKAKYLLDYARAGISSYILDLLDDPREDTTRQRMSRLCDFDAKRRREILARYTAFWIEHNIPPLDLIACLTAAGMSREQSIASIVALSKTIPDDPDPPRIAAPKDPAASETPATPPPKSTVIRSAEFMALGIEWIFYPWFFVARERLAFSLFEFWITMLGCGVSMGLLVSRLSMNNTPIWVDVLVSYAVLHTFLVALLGGVYEARRRRLKDPGRSSSQVLLVILFEIPAILAWICVGLSINVPYRR